MCKYFDLLPLICETRRLEEVQRPGISKKLLDRAYRVGTRQYKSFIATDGEQVRSREPLSAVIDGISNNMISQEQVNFEA